MKYLIAGGDERAIFAAAELAKENEVAAFAMEKAALPENVRKTDIVENADCVILPVPAECNRLGALNAPFSEKSVSAAAVLDKLPAGTPVCGGKLSQRLKKSGEQNGLKLTDLTQRPEFTAGNAAITAEAAAAILMQRTDFALFGRCAIVVGYGRIGKLLTQKLTALGMTVYVMSRNPESRAMAVASGLRALAPEDELPPADTVINTAPAAVMTDLSRFCSPCLMLELASAPGGINPAEAQRLGHRYFAAPGLPGKYAPRTAGELIAETAKNLVKEYGIG